MSAIAKRKSLPAKPDWGQLGPAMRALPNDQWRTFCHELVTGKPGHGRYARAARAAGFGKDSTPENVAKIAWRMAHDDRMIAAIGEESRKYLRSAHPEAVAAILALVRNKNHRDHMRAITEVLSRSDPIVTKQDISVVHKIVDPDQEALEELRAACGQRLVERLDRSPHLRLELDQHAPAVVLVAPPPRKASALQPVDERRDRPAREVHRLGELARAQGAALVEDVERAQVGAVDAEPRRDVLVERLGGVLRAANRRREATDQLPARKSLDVRIFHLLKRLTVKTA